MPNHITNILRISAFKHNGAPEGLAAQVLAALKSEHLPVDFSRIIPMPKDQEDNWYQWSIQNWGTKWNAYMGVTGLIEDTYAIAHFETAWSPPLPVIDKLAEMFPKAHLRLIWCDEGDRKQHRIWWADGKREQDDE